MSNSLAISSKSNEKVKFIKSLNERKYILKNKAFYLEGIKVAEEVLNLREAVDIMFIAYSDEILTKTKAGSEILERLNKDYFKEIESYNFSEKVFEFMCDTVTPQGILIVLKIKEKNAYELIENAKASNENLLIIDKVQDSGNLGTIIRTACAFDLKNIICIQGTASVYSQKVLRSTMGTVLKVNIVYLAEDKIYELKERLHENGFLVVATELETDLSVEKLDFGKSQAFVLGNEANGVSKDMLEISDKKVKIDMSANTDSLNVSVAAGIILYKQYKAK